MPPVVTKRIALCVAALCIGGLTSFAQADDAPRVIASGEWSKPVADSRGYALRGRLVICEQQRGDRRETPVYVELQDACEFIGQSMRLYCDMGKHDFRPEYKGGLNCELRDKDDKPVEPTSFPFGGATPISQWVTLPKDATIRLRATPFGISRDKALSICPHLGKLWVIADDDPNDYSLSGTFTIDPAEALTPADLGNDHIWRGTLELPAVKLGGKGK
jgi:hypothetical protein